MHLKEEIRDEHKALMYERLKENIVQTMEDQDGSIEPPSICKEISTFVRI